jgi:hypothetical protein
VSAAALTWLAVAALVLGTAVIVLFFLWPRE